MAAFALCLALPPYRADASLPSAIAQPQLTQASAPTLPAGPTAPSYVLLYVAPDGSFRVEFCRNDPVNSTDPLGLVTEAPGVLSILSEDSEYQQLLSEMGAEAQTYQANLDKRRSQLARAEVLRAQKGLLGRLLDRDAAGFRQAITMVLPQQHWSATKAFSARYEKIVSRARRKFMEQRGVDAVSAYVAETTVAKACMAPSEAWRYKETYLGGQFDSDSERHMHGAIGAVDALVLSSLAVDGAYLLNGITRGAIGERATFEIGELMPNGMPAGAGPGGDFFGNFKKLSDGQLKALRVDAHALKAEFVGKANVSRFNIAVNEEGAVVLTPVRMGEAPVTTGMRIDELAGEFPR